MVPDLWACATARAGIGGAALLIGLAAAPAGAQPLVCDLDAAVHEYVTSTRVEAIASGRATTARAEAAAAGVRGPPAVAADIELDGTGDVAFAVLATYTLDRTVQPDLTRAVADARAAEADAAGALAAAQGHALLARLWADAVAARDELEPREVHVAHVLQTADIVNRLVDAGEVGAIDGVRIAAVVDRAQVDRDAGAARAAALRALLAARAPTTCPASAELPRRHRAPTLSPDALLARLSAAVDSATADRAVAERAGRPTIELGAGPRLVRGADEWSPGAALTLAVAPGSRRRARLELLAVDSRADSARLELAAAENRATTAAILLRSADDARDRATAYGARVAERGEALRAAADTAYAAGEIDIFDVVATLQAVLDDTLHAIAMHEEANRWAAAATLISLGEGDTE